MITCSLGLDLGGTHIKAAVVGREGQLLDQTLAPTPAGRELEPVVAALDALCRQMLRAHPDIQSLGIGAPGLVDLSRKIVRVAPNFPAWHNIPLQEMAAAQVALPVQIENDVNCFALAEHRWGAGRGAKNMVALAVGTGVGGALVLNGRLYRGAGLRIVSIKRIGLAGYWVHGVKNGA